VIQEYATGTYSAWCYFLSKSLFELALCLLQTLVQFLLLYFLISFQANFFLFVLVAWTFGVTDVKTAAQFQPLLYTPQVLFSGFLIQIKQIPAWLRWVQYRELVVKKGGL
jgi:hypothetical protein